MTTTHTHTHSDTNNILRNGIQSYTNVRYIYLYCVWRYKSHKNYEPNACYHNRINLLRVLLATHSGTKRENGCYVNVIRRIAASCILLINFPEMYQDIGLPSAPRHSMFLYLSFSSYAPLSLSHSGMIFCAGDSISL